MASQTGLSDAEALHRVAKRWDVQAKAETSAGERKENTLSCTSSGKSENEIGRGDAIARIGIRVCWRLGNGGDSQRGLKSILKGLWNRETELHGIEKNKK